MEITPQQIEEIKTKLDDQVWRLENLYYITDINGHKVKFKMNAAQKALYNNRWYKNLILKSRQHGITTFVAIFFLDSVLFNSNQQALIIAHTQADARKIFDNKVSFAFDNLPKWLKEQYAVDTDNQNVLKFKTNGSSISVATSGRSGTYQYLHISEFGVLCFRYPEKAKEIVTGSLNTVHVGKSVTFIESTAKGRFGYFYDYCMSAMAAKKLGRELTQLDWRFFFFGWQENEADRLDGDVVISSEMQDYFQSLKEKDGIELTKEQKNWYVKTLENQGEDMMSEFPSTPEEAFKASIEGAYYTKQMNRMFGEKRIGYVPHDPALMVYTWWDLGVGDETVIGFFQFSGMQIRFIDEYYASGEGLQHYARVLQDKAQKRGFVYGGHFAPHDIEVRELGSNAETRRKIAKRLGIDFQVVPQHEVDVGIDKVRTMLAALWADEEHCEKTISALQSYRKEFDEKLGTWRPKPLHSWESHYADMLRMLAMTYHKFIGNTELNRVKDKEEKRDHDRMEEERERSGFNAHSPVGGAF